METLEKILGLFNKSRKKTVGNYGQAPDTTASQQKPVDMIVQKATVETTEKGGKAALDPMLNEYIQTLESIYSRILGESVEEYCRKGWGGEISWRSVMGYEERGIEAVLRQNGVIYKGIWAPIGNRQSVIDQLEVVKEHGYVPHSERMNGMSTTVFPEIAEDFAKGDTYHNGYGKAEVGVLYTFRVHDDSSIITPSRAPDYTSEHGGYYASPHYTHEGEIFVPAWEYYHIDDIVSIKVYKRKKYPDKGYEIKEFLPTTQKKAVRRVIGGKLKTTEEAVFTPEEIGGIIQYIEEDQDRKYDENQLQTN